MAKFDDVTLFGNTSLSDIFKQIHRNNKDTDKQINELIDALKPLAKAGITSGLTAGATALGLAKRAGKSVVCGHTHRAGLTHWTQSYFGGTPKTVWGLETGCLMDFKFAKYIKGGLFTWQQGFGILYVDGKTVVPSVIPIQRDGTFIVEGKVWGR